jgi:hypothetical protein
MNFEKKAMNHYLFLFSLCGFFFRQKDLQKDFLHMIILNQNVFHVMNQGV